MDPLSDEVDLEDVLADAYPRCGVCGTPLEVRGEITQYWWCPSCGTASGPGMQVPLP